MNAQHVVQRLAEWDGVLSCRNTAEGILVTATVTAHGDIDRDFESAGYDVAEVIRCLDDAISDYLKNKNHLKFTGIHDAPHS